MFEIIFQKQEDAKGLIKYLQRHLSSESGKINLLFEDPHIIKLTAEANADIILADVKQAFYEFIIYWKREQWFRTILAENYFFNDTEEQSQIMEIIYSILDGNREELAVLLQDTNEENILKEAMDDLFQKNLSFSFDSFVKFRLRPYLDCLEKYVEISIDEYKMEQEYQIFIQTLRDFLAEREMKIRRLHLLINDGSAFFDEHFYEIKRADLVRMIDRKLLFNHPVYVDSVTIAPLLSIAPAMIFLYTEDRDEPLVRTICNIFEERVTIQAVADFNDRKSFLPYTAEEKM
ncbi:putative sporulation protein YtxC [Bacillus canaveralius]|uniref:Sporulation protein YtxC n=1 Tax=Bacillus canaveralius TaxID=1403243 RepID=A0A2N5GJU4_9BACI|nr:putative sporulation protein YtxC [Bacillus canaveralius]PLR81501.1 putative sporulation protein YtxC [Bacillus canaveralius]PLR93885.1 putative sporulation protein YtxC [Bacillus canaveralius]